VVHRERVHQARRHVPEAIQECREHGGCIDRRRQLVASIAPGKMTGSTNRSARNVVDLDRSNKLQNDLLSASRCDRAIPYGCAPTSAAERCRFARIDFVARRKVRGDADLVGQRADRVSDVGIQGPPPMSHRAMATMPGRRDVVSGEPTSKRPRGS